MKLFLFLLLLTTFYLLQNTSIHAQTIAPSKLSPTQVEKDPTPTKKPNPIQNQINNLKDRIASRVAELQLVERRGIIGTVNEVSGTQITISDIQGDKRFIDVDELTKFASDSAKDGFGISDIEKGTRLGVLGLYNKQSRRILARFVDVLIIPKTVEGTITSVDEDNFTVSLITDDKKEYTADIENTTKTNEYVKDSVVKSGFSKLIPGNFVIVKGFESDKDPNRLTASRILTFPDISKEIEILTPQVSPTIDVKSTVAPSTGSGKKLTPIR